jgi:hypothetical protein
VHDDPLPGVRFFSVVPRSRCRPPSPFTHVSFAPCPITPPNPNSVIALMDPKSSWAARWHHLSELSVGVSPR